jgi:hypothetical protein
MDKSTSRQRLFVVRIDEHPSRKTGKAMDRILFVNGKHMD